MSSTIEKTLQRVVLWYGLAGLIVLADQYTKTLATQWLAYGQPQQVLPFLNWTLLHNTGAAFSFLSDAGGWQRWFFCGLSLVVSLVLAVWLVRLPRSAFWQALALAMIMGGALGNLWDRLVLGYVVDFIQVHYQHRYFFPAFNIADSAISVGAVLLILDSFLGKHKESSE